MWFGDLLKNNSKNTQIRRFDPGVKAFNAYIRQSLATRKPYDQMVRELITAAGPQQLHTGGTEFHGWRRGHRRTRAGYLGSADG